MSATSSVPSRVQAGFLGVVGGFLIAAAVLKGHQIAYTGMPAASLFKSVPLHILIVAVEFLLGVWLLTGLYLRVTRRVAIVFFFGLLQVALWMALSGQSSCGCLGQLEVNPWFAVVVDLAILAGLALLRLDESDRTIRTHRLRFCGFLFAAVGLGLPGFMTMAVYRREASRAYSYELHHDRLLHKTKIAVDLRQPTVHELVALVATHTGLELSVDESVKEHFDSCQPDWNTINHRSRRGWALLEAVSQAMPVPSRWIKTETGYTLVFDDPLWRARRYWLAGLSFAAAGVCWLAWSARQISATAHRSAKLMAGVLVAKSSHTA